MKKHPIIKEYKNKSVPGLEVMREQISFLSSKMMDIEDLIDISSTITPEDIAIYNYPTTSVHMKEMYKHKLNYSYDYIKQKYVTLIEDKSQNKSEHDFNTNWEFTLDSDGLLKEFLYNEFFVYNPNNDFSKIDDYYESIGLSSDYNISDLVKDYIEENIINKYRFKSFKLYTKYYSLENNKITAIDPTKTLDDDVQILIKNPVFDIKAIPKDRKDIEVVSIKPYIDGKFKINYKQLKSSKLETFIYYFDVQYEKI